MIESNSQFLIYYSIINFCYFVALTSFHLVKINRLVLGGLLTIVLSLLYSIRTGDVGSDASNYLLLISDNNTFTQSMSPIIIFIGRFVNALSGNGIMFFFIISCISNLITLFAFYKIDKKNYLILMAIFSVSFLFVNLNINILRQGMAISVGVLAIYYIVNYQFSRYFIAVVLALFIHSSAVILFILPIILRVEKKKTVYICVFILTILYLSSTTIVNFLYYLKDLHWSINRLHWYLTWENIQQFNLKHVYYLYLALIAVYLYQYDNVSTSLKRYFLVFLSILVLMVAFRNDDFIVDRFSFYFIPIAVVLYVKLYTVLKIYRNNLYIFLFISLPFLWLAKSAYQFNLWWILGVMR